MITFEQILSTWPALSGGGVGRFRGGGVLRGRRGALECVCGGGGGGGGPSLGKGVLWGGGSWAGGLSKTWHGLKLARPSGLAFCRDQRRESIRRFKDIF